MCKLDFSTRTFHWHLPTPAFFLAACLTLLAGAAFGAPVITSVTPTTGGPGVNVVLTGTGFSTVTSVQFNGTTAPKFTVVSDAEIDVTPPAGAATGQITATSPTGTGSSPVAFTVVAAPANDNFANAQSLGGSAPLTVTGTNAGATKQTGESVLANGGVGGRSIWYSFTPTASGDYTVTTRGSDFNTILGVFTGTQLNALTEVGSNDDADDLSTSSVTFTATRGAIYSIVVDGSGGAAGNVRLSVLSTTTGISLYQTGFETTEGFTTSIPLVGQNGWASVGNATGGNGVVGNRVPNLGLAGFVGGGVALRNGATSVQVFQPVSYTASEEDEFSLVNFATVLKFTASTNGRADRFGFTASGAANNSAAAEAAGRYFTIFFDEATHTVSYQLNDGSAAVPTGVPYSDGVAYVLQEELDFSFGEWSATLNGVPLATGKTLADAGGGGEVLTRISADYTPANVANPGDNAMSFDGYAVAVPDLTTGLPTLLVQPSSQTVAAGQPTLFLVEPIGFGSFTYQWLYEGSPISGATGPTYTIPITSPTDAGRYSVLVNSAGGPVQSADAFLVVSTTLAAVSAVVQNNPQVPQVTSGQLGSVLLTRTGDLSGALTINYRVGGTALSGVDYQALSGTATIKAGRSKKRIKVVTIDRGIHDGSSVKVAIKVLDGNGYTPGTSVKQKVTIVRD